MHGKVLGRAERRIGTRLRQQFREGPHQAEQLDKGLIADSAGLQRDETTRLRFRQFDVDDVVAQRIGGRGKRFTANGHKHFRIGNRLVHHPSRQRQHRYFRRRAATATIVIASTATHQGQRRDQTEHDRSVPDT